MSLCRLCLTENEVFHKLYGDNGCDIPSLAPIVSQWFQIASDDVVSTHICSSCWTVTLNFHFLCCKVVKAQNDLCNNPGFVKHLASDSSQDAKKVSPNVEPIDCIAVSAVLDYQPKTESFDPIECKVEHDSDASAAGIEEALRYRSDSQSDDSDKKPTPTIAKRTRKIKTEPRNPSTGSSDDSENDSKPLGSIKKRQKRSKPVKRSHSDEDSDAVTSSNNEKPLNKRNRKMENIQIRQFCNMFCNLCTTNFETFAEAYKHYSDCHNTKGYLICCDRKFTRRNRVVDHIQVHLNPDAYRCKICEKTFSGKFSLRNHMDIHKSEDQKPFQCDQCPSKYTRYVLLARHKFQSHCNEEDKVFVCDMCKKKFLTKSKLTAHIKRVHNAIPEICDYCGKEFKCKYNLNVHRTEAHMGLEITRLQCNVCGVWLRENYLAKHIKSHNAKVETCSICSKVLQNKKSLNNHMRNVHGNRVHQCAICGKAFPKPLSLKEHMALHTGEDLYKCPYCTKTFKSGANMHAHRKKAHFNEWEQDRGKRLVDGRYK